ncbi:hypothetical protein QBC42DRAFT_290462, partial [Cladorrhinum samala]
MVSRKPVPSNAMFDPAVPSHARTPPPYPDTSKKDPWPPTGADEDSVWASEPTQTPQQQRLGGSNSTSGFAPNDVPSSLRPGSSSGYVGIEDENNVWAEGNSHGNEQVPQVLLPGGNRNTGSNVGASTVTGPDPAHIPAVLQPAGGALKTETNPFKRKMIQHQEEARSKPQVSAAPVVAPIPTETFQALSLNDPNNNPWEPTVGGPAPPPPVPGFIGQQELEKDNIWDSAKPSRQPTPGPGPAMKTPELLSLSLPSEEDSAEWADVKRTMSDAPKLVTTEENEVLDDSHAWDDLGNLKANPASKPPPIPSKGASGSGDEWNMIDIDSRPGPPSRRSTWEDFGEEDN